MSTAPFVTRPLETDTDCDVCVVGGGITGLTLAYLLSPSHRVIVVERDAVGCGDTSRSTGHLTPVLDTDYADLARSLGEDGARVAAQAHAAAVDFIGQIVAAESIDCAYERVDGLLVGKPGEEADLDHRRESAARAGLHGVRAETAAPFEKSRALPCLRFPRQAQLDPLRYAYGLAKAIERRGGEIFGRTTVTRVTGGMDARLECARGPIVSASAAVLATHAPLGGRPGIHARITPYRTYVIAGAVPKDSVPRTLVWDTASPYHYVRLAPRSAAQDFLIVGGEDHRTGEPVDADERYEALERWARERFPSLGALEHRWSGQVFEPSDGLGFAGLSGKETRPFLVAGHSGNGLTHGTLSAILLASLIQKGSHPWEAVFDPARGGAGRVVDMAKKGLEAAAQYTERLKGGEVESVDAIEPGQGAIVGRGAEKIAAYRDPDGVLWECSALCSHMGCVVRWNAGEQSWDCPCHGSRFDARGGLLAGPASTGLAPARRKAPR